MWDICIIAMYNDAHTLRFSESVENAKIRSDNKQNTHKSEPTGRGTSRASDPSRTA